MVTLIYAWNKLHSAILTLTLRDDPARLRLLDAISVQLDEILTVTEIQDIPEELQERITRLHKIVTENGSYLNTILEMNQNQVQDVIREIICLFHKISIVVERLKECSAPMFIERDGNTRRKRSGLVR